MDPYVASESTVGFLIGAGVSIPCGAPTTSALTADLLVPTIPYMRATDERYYPLRDKGPAPTPHGVPALEQVSALLGCLRPYVDGYYGSRVNAAGCVDREVNYEDLAYLVVQLSEAINRERDNPALLPFIQAVESELAIGADALRNLADEAIALINDHVSHRLSGLVPCANHLQCVIDACRANEHPAVPILSLNHDCLVEATLRRASIAFGDMTRTMPDGRRILDGSPLHTGATLYKLHGSTDWFRWRPVHDDQSTAFWGEWIGSLTHAEAQSAWRADERALILVGRFNKELSYASSPFSELFAYARQALRRTDSLVVSGYSFGDKSINAMLIEWIYAAPLGKRRILLAHRDPSSVQRAARGAIANKWERWLHAGALRTVDAYLGDLSWSDVREAL